MASEGQPGSQSGSATRQNHGTTGFRCDEGEAMAQADSQGSEATSHVQAVRRSVRLLAVLAGASGDLPLSVVSKQARLAPSTAHRLLLTLASDGLVTPLPNGRFRLGAEMARLGNAAIRQMRTSPQLHDLLGSACEAIGETIGLVQVVDGAATVVDKVESAHPLRYNLGVGTQVPAHCTASGKVLLAFASEDVREALLARGLPSRTAATITDRRRLLAELDAIRAWRFALDHEEFQQGLCCVAMPVRDFGGAVAYAVAASGPAQRFYGERTAEIIDALRGTVRAMEAALGFDSHDEADAVAVERRVAGAPPGLQPALD